MMTDVVEQRKSHHRKGFNHGRWRPFGVEYGYHPKWHKLQQWYIRLFGVVDLPSRLRCLAIMQQTRRLQWNALLDLGCGTGCYSFYFSRCATKRVVGIDVDESRIQESRIISKRLGRRNLRFVVGSDYEGFPEIGTHTADLVLAIEVLQYVPDVNFALAEISRWLRPGGHLVGHVPALGYLREYENTLFSDDSLIQLLVGAGFDIESLIPTFGRSVTRLCQVFERVSFCPVLAGFVLPFLLLISMFFQIEATNGNYRLFVARKPYKAGAQV
jgi:SAM-dependent methyltransferase